MEYTTNYHLPQWVETDRILMADFNNAMASIESGITDNKAAAETAQSTAAAAQQTANTARDEAAVLPYAVGSYAGTEGDVTVNVGFRPRFVIICGHKEGDAMNTDKNILYAFGATGGSVVPNRIRLTDTGFVACARGSGTYYPDFSLAGRRYDYIAFR